MISKALDSLSWAWANLCILKIGRKAENVYLEMEEIQRRADLLAEEIGKAKEAKRLKGFISAMRDS